MTKRAMVATAGAVLALAAGRGTALAQGGPGGPRGGPPDALAIASCGGLGGAPVASYLGLSQAELRTQLRSGKSLAQVATAQGKTVAGLKAAILADAKQKLDQAVADGRLTAAQAQQRLADLTSHIDEIVNATGPFHPRGGPRG